MKRILTLLLCALAMSATAQTQQQKGVVRMITSPSDTKVQPVSGVQVRVDNELSPKTAKNGMFTMRVQPQFTVRGVVGNDDYILLPNSQNNQYFASKNNVEVVVTTKQRQKEDIQRMYRQIKGELKAKNDSLINIKTSLEALQLEFSTISPEYRKLQDSIRQLQAGITAYFDNEEQTSEDVRNIAEKLSLIDYRTLDAWDKEIYDRRMKGDWEGMSDLIGNTIMKGDFSGYLLEGNAIEERARRERAYRFQKAEELIESLKMRHKNDQVAMRYDELINADSSNWGYLVDAGQFMMDNSVDLDKAIAYFTQAARHAANDSALAICYNEIGLVYQQLFDLDKALEYGERALNMQLAALGEDHPDVASSYNNVGLVYFFLGDVDKCMDYCRRALVIRRHDNGGNNADIATNFVNMGYLFSALGQFDSAMYYYQLSEAKSREFQGTDYTSEMIIALGNISTVYSEKGQYEEALKYIWRSIAICDSIFKGPHPTRARLYYNLGSMYNKMVSSRGLQLTDSAEYYLLRSIEEGLGSVGNNNEVVANSYNELATVYSEKKDFDKAFAANKKSLDINISMFGEISHNTAVSLGDMGSIFYRMGQYDSALYYFSQSLHIDTLAIGPGNYYLGATYRNLASVYFRMGQYDKAIQTYEKSLAIQIPYIGEVNEEVTNCYYNMALIYVDAKNYEKAIEYYEKTLANDIALYGENSKKVGSILYHVGKVYAIVGQIEKGLDYCQRGLSISLNYYAEDSDEVSRITSTIEQIKSMK